VHRRPSLPGPHVSHDQGEEHGAHEHHEEEDQDDKHGAHEHQEDHGDHELEEQGQDEDQGGPNHEDDEDDLNQDVDDQDCSDHGNQEGGHGHRVPINSDDMAFDSAMQPNSGVEYFFVNCDSADAEVTKEVGCLNPGVDEPTSITRFLTLPTVTRQRHTKIRDPIFDFAQSKILTSDEYTMTAEELKLAKEMAQRAKEQQCADKVILKRRREVERKEEGVARAAAKEQAARMKELRTAEQAALRANQQAVRDEAQRLRAECLAQVAAEKATKAAEKARKAAKRQEQQHLRAARVAEIAEGGQGGRGSMDTVPTGVEPWRCLPQTFPLQFQSALYIFQHPKTSIFSSHLLPPSPAHLSFQQLNTPMQSTQPSHPMLYFSFPFQVFQMPLHHSLQWTREMSNQQCAGVLPNLSGR
jgi:hypothetical protein